MHILPRVVTCSLRNASMKASVMRTHARDAHARTSNHGDHTAFHQGNGHDDERTLEKESGCV